MRVTCQRREKPGLYHTRALFVLMSACGLAHLCVSQGILTEVPRLQHIVVVDNMSNSWPKYQPSVSVHNMAAVQKLGARSDNGKFVLLSYTLGQIQSSIQPHFSKNPHVIWKKCFLTIVCLYTANKLPRNAKSPSFTSFACTHTSLTPLPGE